MATEAEEKEQTTAEPVVEKPVEPEQKPKKPPKPPKQREILLPILTILFVLVGIAELGLLFVTGFGVFRGSQARRAYEAQQAELQNEPERSLGASYCGPGLMIENGEVVWRRVDDLTQNGQGSGQGTETGGGAQATEYVLKTPYPPPPWNKPDMSSTGEPEEPVQT